MNEVGLYLPGDSPLHRLPAAAKVVALVAVGASAAFLLDTPVAVTLALVTTVVTYVVARVPASTAAGQVRPLLWVLVPTAVFHVLATGWRQAYVVVGVILLLVLLAALVTLTTRTTALVDTLAAAARPLRPFGIDPDRVALVLALGIRCVPVAVGLAHEVREAQLARGLGASPRAFAVPLIVRSLRRADALGEALVARGAED